ncbi:hypothetical protein ACU610_09160 [Geodermatophilus sp. URMC 61]|uniref:hypothetical protein n=1 Tax=Geodermatophilus sp. URMC 61 TaxID=3423411 RepID=UPI00406C8246
MAQGPASMPVLSRGRHRNPARGACFMEYTALLAGEPFTDTPDCVDGELAAVLRHANDRLSDGDRFRLTPLLGRAIGLVVPGPAVPRRQRRSARRAAGADGHALAVHVAAVGELRTAVARRFTAALGSRPSPAEWRGHACGRDVDRLFWSLMLEPTPVSTSAAYVDRLLDRLVLLHECYELAMAQLGLARRPPGAGAETVVVAATDHPHAD